MNVSKQILLSWLFLSLPFSCFARIKNRKAKHQSKKIDVSLAKKDSDNIESLGDIVQKLATAGSKETEKMYDSVQAAAQTLEKSIAINADKLKAAAEKRILKLQQTTEAESKKLFERYTQQSTILNQEATKQISQLKYKAAQDILSLINQAEQEAIKVKQKAREDVLRKKIGIQPLTESKEARALSWKELMRDEFSELLSYMQEIIINGEDSYEAQDFLTKLNQQAIVLDTVLSTTKHPSENAYVKLEQKKSALENIVNTQKEAETLLQDQIQIRGISQPNYNKLRLLLLYEINLQMHKKSKNGLSALAATKLSEEEKKEVVGKAIQEGLLIAKQATEKTPTQIAITSFQKEKEMLSLTEELSKTKKLLENEQREKMNVKTNAHQKLEAISRENLELQTIIIDNNQKLASFKEQDLGKTLTELTNANAQIKEQKKLSAQSETRARIIDELAERRLYDMLVMFDIKKTLLHEQTQSLEQQKKAFTKERDEWLKNLTNKNNNSFTAATPTTQNTPKDKSSMKIEKEMVARMDLEQELNQKIAQTKAIETKQK
jgi:hypothetical protein